jgi:hypothetical protein
MDTVYQIGFMHLIDHWQFVTAMYLGSSIPRTMGILWLLILFVGNEKITIQDFIKLFIVSVVVKIKYCTTNRCINKFRSLFGD